MKARIKTVPLKQGEVGRELQAADCQGVPAAWLRDSVPGAEHGRAANLETARPSEPLSPRRRA